MTNSRRTRKNISKELMFNKIMPSYLTNTYTEYYANSNGTQNPEARNPRSEPDTFKIREKVLSKMEDRPLVSEQGNTAPVMQPQQYQQGEYASNQPQQQPYANNYQQNPAAQQYAPKAVIEEDKPKYINITEEVLYSKLSNMIAMFKCCNCEKCRQTIMLHVLNNVKPEYVYKKPSEVKELIESNNYVDINQPIIRAILDTKSNPPHKR